jgi:hypothetical protein
MPRILPHNIYSQQNLAAEFKFEIKLSQRRALAFLAGRAR